jgi:hypothetical protein
MTDSSDDGYLRAIVEFQLSVLELYESLLETCAWDEAKANTALKTFMVSVLALMRVQRSLGAQVVTVQKDLIRQHRARLEQWLAEHGEDPVSAGGEGGPR